MVRPAGARRPRRRRIASALAGTAAWLATAAGAPARAEDPLSGPAAWARIVGNTIAGTTPDGPYSELFRPDGTLTIVDADGKAGGRWSLRDDRLCTQVDDEDEEDCRSLSVAGDGGTFTDQAGSRYAFDILPGNPKGL